MQPPTKRPPPPNVVLDGQLEGNLDTLLGLALLSSLATLAPPEARVGAVSLTGSGIQAAAFCDAVLKFYVRAAQRNYPERFRRYRGLPIGLASSGELDAAAPSMFDAVLAKTTAAGEPVYEHDVDEFTDTADAAALVRNALTARKDAASVVVLAGPATNLAAVLNVNGARELIKAKVRRLVVALGDLPSAGTSAYSAADVAAAQELFERWPTPIVAVGSSIGDRVRYPAARIAADLAWAANHPIADAYFAHEASSHAATTHAAAAVLYAVRPKAEYFGLSQPGRIRIRNNDGLQFDPDPAGPHAYLTLDAAQEEALAAAYFELTSAEPAALELPDSVKKAIEEQKKKAASQRKPQP